jgi:hypothetical protein
VTPGPADRKCTPYLAAGPGGAPLGLPLSKGLGRMLKAPCLKACPLVLKKLCKGEVKRSIKGNDCVQLQGQQGFRSGKPRIGFDGCDVTSVAMRTCGLTCFRHHGYKPDVTWVNVIMLILVRSRTQESH